MLDFHAKVRRRVLRKGFLIAGTVISVSTFYIRTQVKV